MTDITDRRARARARLHDLDARDEARRRREEELPRAVCSICGGIVAAGTGTIAPEGWQSVEQAREWGGIDAERARKKLAPLMAWRRRHNECQTTSQMVRAILDVDVPDQIAGAALAALRLPLTARNLWDGVRVRIKPSLRPPRDVKAILGRREPRPWSHLTADDVEELRRAIAKEQAVDQPRRCVDGACAWCGVSASPAWTRSPERWSDGSPAPLCAECAAVWDSDGQPGDHESLRGAALHALSGARAFTLTGLGIRTFADIAGGDHDGHSTPWVYAEEPLAALRERARMTWPSTLPAHLRQDYAERSRTEQRESYYAAVQREQQADRDRATAQARAEGWPV